MNNDPFGGGSAAAPPPAQASSNSDPFGGGSAPAQAQAPAAVNNSDPFGGGSKPAYGDPVHGPGTVPVQQNTHPLLNMHVPKPLVPIVSGAERAALTGVNNIFDVLNRPAQAFRAAGLEETRPTPEGGNTAVDAITAPFRGMAAGAKTLVHGQSQESADQTRAEMRDRTGLSGAYSQMNHIERGSLDFLLDTATDPLTYVGGSGLLERGVRAGGGALASKFYSALKTLGESDKPEVRAFAAKVAAAHDKMNYAGRTLRTMGARPGGIEEFKGLKTGGNIQRTRSEDMQDQLLHGYNDVIRGLTPEEESAVYQGGRGGVPVPPKLQPRVARLQYLNQAQDYLTGDATMRNEMRQQGYKLPKEFSRFNQAHRDEGLKYPPRGGTVASDIAPSHSIQQTVFHQPEQTPLAPHAQPLGQPGVAYHAPLPKPIAPRPVEQIPTGGMPGRITPQAPIPHIGPIPAEVPRPEIRPGVAGHGEIPGNHNVEGINPIPGEKPPEPTPLMGGRGTGETRAPHTMPTAMDQRMKNIERIQQSAKNIGNEHAKQYVQKFYGAGTWEKVPQEARDYFESTIEKPENRGFWENFVANPWRQAIDMTKVGLFALPLRHQANIATLSLFADPHLANVFGTAGRYARLMYATLPENARQKIADNAFVQSVPKVGEAAARGTGNEGEQRAKILGPAYEYGLAGERRTLGERIMGHPEANRSAGGWVGNIPGLGYLYKLSNNALWNFDDAIKATRMSRLMAKYVKQGMERDQAAAKAADDVGGELIDYSNSSPFTKAMANIAPFATYRTKIPGAVARVATRHPERINMAGRMAPEMVGDTQQAPPDEQTGESQVGKAYLPVPDVLKGFGSVPGALGYSRSTGGWPIEMAAAGVEDAISAAKGQAPDPYFTYGKVTDLPSAANYALNQTVGQFPGGSALLSHIPTNSAAGQAGLGPLFKQQGDWKKNLESQVLPFGLSGGPRQDQLDAAAWVAQQDQQIDSAQKAGDLATVKELLEQRKTYLKYHHLFVP